MKIRSFSIIGGDQRSIKLAALLDTDGHMVYTYGFENARLQDNIDKSNDLFSAIGKSDMVIGPIPFTTDGVNITAPFHTSTIGVKDVISSISAGKLLIAGRINDDVKKLLTQNGIDTIDLLQREDMAVLNAIPTAEGAIQIAMEETPFTLHGSYCLVLGYGRIGKLLSKMLFDIGARVTVVARKYSDLAWIQGYGYTPVHMKELNEVIAKANIIFNTVPNVILDRTLLKMVKKDTLVIDLASNPGGVDYESAKELGLRTIHALSLPGKVAPETAAIYIRKTIYNIISEMEGK